jgi:putative NADPH-quinone reductase
MLRNDALAFVFPVWWWSLPATTKGWIDRVWNNGWAYGARTLPHRRALVLGTAAGSAASYEKRGYDQAMRIQLLTRTMEYCGIPESELHLLFDVLETGRRGTGTWRERGNWGNCTSVLSASRLRADFLRLESQSLLSLSFRRKKL